MLRTIGGGHALLWNADAKAVTPFHCVTALQDAGAPKSSSGVYTVLSGGDLSQPLVPVKNVAGRMPVTELVVKSRSGDQFYRVFREAGQHIQLPE